MKDNSEEIEWLKEQLEQVKQHDRVLEEIEKRLYEMKEIAEYASKYRLSGEEKREFEKQIEEQKIVIESLQGYSGL
ncbi:MULTISPECIES: hypothetical protein [unclassified Sporosarcina]|uniref:hypothetical protein n=1 Tax=unclassified Sporosarcina TaxID=2647733 RepID=UPI000C16D8DF|nr:MULTISPECIES: hypothetical protein [unclassified Sporosarcina]PID05012.1 hypothetical protein CSV66_11970 [Sporosarcina sp. P30]PID08012.1 hypothetical protein CSV65_13110 [Sporosarcina sp. P31]PID11766.1 hypothetical protein CSV64_10205 [Sporosarcina sp. P32b]